MNPPDCDITISIDQDTALPESEQSMFISIIDMSTADQLVEVYDRNGKEVWSA